MLTQNTAPAGPTQRSQECEKKVRTIALQVQAIRRGGKAIKATRERRMRKQGWADMEYDVGFQRASQSWVSSMRTRQGLASEGKGKARSDHSLNRLFVRLLFNFLLLGGRLASAPLLRLLLLECTAS